MCEFEFSVLAKRNLKYQDFINIIDLIEDSQISQEIENRLNESKEFVNLEDLEALKCTS